MQATKSLKNIIRKSTALMHALLLVLLLPSLLPPLLLLLVLLPAHLGCSVWQASLDAHPGCH
jgi:hypothetical protein